MDGLWLNILVAVLAVGTLALVLTVAWYDAKRARDAAEAQFLTLPASPINGLTYKIDPGCGATPDLLLVCLHRAWACLVELGPWGRLELQGALAGLQVLVRHEGSWVDTWGRKVAGYAVLPQHQIVVGCDLAALAHELAEVAYASLEHREGFHADGQDWPGRQSLDRAIERYLSGH
jgi:hypothetical protein